MKIVALVLAPALAFADPGPQQQAPQPRQPPQIAVGGGLVGTWMFDDGACTTSTNWTFRPDGSGEAQRIEFRYTRTTGSRFHLVWTAQQITQDYTLVVDGDRMTSYLLDSEPRICRWKRT